jgi:Uma2 family endonuclease
MSLRDMTFVHLLTELTRYARENQSGTVLPRTLIYIEEKEVAVIPDIVFVKRARSGTIQKNRICGVPDLIVEIVSNPSHRDKLLGKKKDTYARCEVPEYWTVDLPKLNQLNPDPCQTLVLLGFWRGRGGSGKRTKFFIL